MKKVLAGLAFGVVILVNSAFANKDVNEKVAAAFKQEFVQATDVSWYKADTYYRAVFTMNDNVCTAFFTEEGGYIGVSRNLSSTELPIRLQTSLKKDYAGYWITDLFEYARPDGSSYFITIENADQKITLQSTEGFNWSVYRKFKK